MRYSLRAVSASIAPLGVAAMLLSTSAAARADYTVSSCGTNANAGVFAASLPSGGSITDTGSACPASAGSGLLLTSSQSVNGGNGSRGAWQANAPAGLEIVAAS